MIPPRVTLPIRLPSLLAGGLAAALLGPAATTVSAASAAAASSASTTVSVPCASTQARHEQCYVRLGHGGTTTHVAAAGAGIVAATSLPQGFGPGDLQSAYNLASSSMGRGQTIAVVDAYGYPTAATDLAAYRSMYGLPACGAGCFTQVNESGATTNLPASDPSGWEIEEALDLEMVSASCPNCHILLVDASSTEDTDLYAAVDTAVRLGAREVSMSWGATSTDSGWLDAQYDSAHFEHAGIAFLAAAGDNGYGTFYPAASRYVTSVGGTTLSRASNARGWTETAWSGTGGGCSNESVPAWQNTSATGCGYREENDVAAVADPATGVAFFCGSCSDPTNGYYGGWDTVGGTSAATPLVAGMVALYGGQGSNTGGQMWWQGAPANDVSAGSNGSCAVASWCTAGAGYDGPTGFGTPANTPMATVNAFANPIPTAQFSVSWTPSPSLSGRSVTYRVWTRQGNRPWTQWITTSATSATFDGVAGQSYDFAVQTTLSGYDSGPARGAAQATATVSGAASSTLPFRAMYAADSLGAIHPASSATVASSSNFSFNIARGVAVQASGAGGYVVDGYGGLHPFGTAPAITGSGYWPGWDITRGIALRADGVSGYTLDAFGGVHSFGGAPQVLTTGYFPGWDICRGIVLRPDGRSGYVLDGWGGMHPFGVSGDIPGAPSLNAYWPGWDIAKSVTINGDGLTGYELDGFGGLHPWAAPGSTKPPLPYNQMSFYWGGSDVARAVVMLPGTASPNQGYVVDYSGGFHPFGPSASQVPPAVDVSSTYGLNAGQVRWVGIA